MEWCARCLAVWQVLARRQGARVGGTAVAVCAEAAARARAPPPSPGRPRLLARFRDGIGPPTASFGHAQAPAGGPGAPPFGCSRAPPGLGLGLAPFLRQRPSGLNRRRRDRVGRLRGEQCRGRTRSDLWPCAPILGSGGHGGAVARPCHSEGAGAVLMAVQRLGEALILGYTSFRSSVRKRGTSQEQIVGLSSINLASIAIEKH
jgi:hypothetical protein